MPRVMSERVQIAQELAMRYHAEQVDKAGHPYYLHVLRVSASGITESEQVVGALHDILEDTNCTVSSLRRYFTDEEVEAVRAITHEIGESQRAYLERVKKNPLAFRVKLYDIRDNLSRVDQLDAATRTRLRAKYSRALELLGMGETL